MLTMFFGERKDPCIDCTEIEVKWICTMNCGPCLPKSTHRGSDTRVSSGQSRGAGEEQVENPMKKAR